MAKTKEQEDFRLVETPSIDYLIAEGTPEVPDDYVPEGFDTVEDYLKDMRETYQNDLDADRENREEALEDKKFTAGEQWDPAVLEARKGLPCLKINTVPQFTAQVVGDWRSSRNSVKVLPSEDGDVDVAEIRADLIRAIEVKSRASRVYDNAFESAVQCGDGAFRVSVEYAREDVFDQEIFIRPIDDALSVVWDHLSVDPTGRDANHCFVDDIYPKKAFEERWPGVESSTLSERYQNDLQLYGWCDDQTVRVTEHWRMVERKKLLALFEDGSIRDVNAENIEELMQKHGNIVRTRVAPCHYAQMHLVTGWTILGGPYEYRLTRLPIIRLTGRTVNIAGRRVRHGLVRDMKDPVRLRNFWRSVAAEQLGYAPKAQWLASADSVEGREDDFRKAHLSRDPLLVYNEGTEKPDRIDPPEIQAALLNEAAVNTQDLKDVTGIHDASLGIRSNETSGRAINARQREGDIANLTYHDNGNASLLEGGDVVNQLIGQVYDGTRVLRLVGEDQGTKFVRVNDPMDPDSIDLSVGTYDVVLSTGTSYMTRRVEAAQAMMEAVQVYPEMMQIAGDLVAKAQDWPGAQELAERLKKTIPPQLLDEEDGGGQGAPQGLPPEALMQMQEEAQAMMEQLQKLQQENEKLKVENIEMKLDKDIDWYKAETDRIKALSDHEVDQGEMQLSAIQALIDKDNSDADREMASAKTTPSGKE